MSTYDAIGFSNSGTIPDDLFILNPAHQKMVTGERNYGYMWSRYGVAGLLITVFIGLMILVVTGELVTEFRLATAPTVQTTGKVIDHRVSVGGKSTTYYLTYHFIVNESTYTREAVVDRREYNSLNIGTEIPVTYLADDPKVSHPGGKGIRWVQFLYLILIIVVLGGMGILWQVIMIPKYLKMRRMRRDGQLIWGQLKGTFGEMIKHTSGRSTRTDYDVTVYCQFKNPNGRWINGQATFTRNDYKRKQLPQAGSVAILYVSGDDYLIL